MLVRGLNRLNFRARSWIRGALLPRLTPWLWRLAWTYAVLLLILALVLIIGQVCRHGFTDSPQGPVMTESGPSRGPPSAERLRIPVDAGSDDFAGVAELVDAGLLKSPA